MSNDRKNYQKVWAVVRTMTQDDDIYYNDGDWDLLVSDVIDATANVTSTDAVKTAVAAVVSTSLDQGMLALNTSLADIVHRITEAVEVAA